MLLVHKGAHSVRSMIMFELVATGISEETIALLKRQGLDVRRSLDIDVPPFPEDITLVDDSELMEIASKYMENYNMVSTQVTCAQIAETEADNDYDYLEATMLIGKSTGKTTEKAGLLKAKVLIDPEIQAKKDVKMAAYAYRKMLETILNNLERYYNLASRELTRRTSGQNMKTNRYTP